MNEKTNTKKRIELIIEKMAFKRACRVFEAAGAKGYTALPTMAGFGNGNRWQRDTDISGSRDMVMMISIGSEETTKRVLDDLESLLGEHVGVVSVSDVEIMRPEKF